ncbi:DUF1631 domain-containing protein [Thioalkalivibrio sulfidiphilus]|uniref:DUF1631 domain-containing protein n=1 Tax=Thioalkalivibrio sulfidiphilus TaxID=1033854 RepID=UPI003BB1628F
MSDGASEKVVPFDVAARRESPGSAMQIIGRCRNLTTTHLERFLKEMLDNTDDALFKLADQAEDNRTQSEYFDAMREVRLKRSTMESEYPSQLARAFDSFLQAGPSAAAKLASAGELELSLVGQEELEENLALEGMITKASRVNKAELEALTRRLVVALNRPKLSEDAHPLTPMSLCESFRSTMKVLDVDLRVRLIIYKLFDKYVVGALPALYQEINRELAERGLLPELKTTATAAQTRRRVSPSQSREIDDEHEPIAGEMADAGELLAALQQLAARGGSPMLPGVTLVDSKSLLSAVPRIPVITPASGSVFTSAELKDVVLTAVNNGDPTGLALNRMDETAIDIVAMLFDFIFDDPALPAPIKELIGRLQIPVLRVAISDRTFFSRKKHPARRLLNELARAGIGWTEAEEREDGLRTRIQSVVDRLVNDASGDTSMFEQELVAFQEWCQDQSERAAQREEQSALAAQGREHLRVAKGVAEESIARLLEGQTLPEPITQLLKTTWKDLLVLIYLKDGQHGKLWQKALNVASLLIWSLLPKSSQAEREQLTGMLPSLLKALQEGMNRMSCSETERQGIIALLAREHARIVRDPELDLDVQSVPAVEHAEHDARPVEQAAAETVRPVDAAVAAPSVQETSTDAETDGASDGRSFMARKVAEINRLISDGRFKVYEEVVIGEAGASEPVDEDQYVQQAREMEEGTWLELTDADGQPLRAKLSWKSLISGKYFFVNRQGLKVKEMTVYGLGAEFRAGRARVIEDVPVFDRAISTLMASLSKSGAPAM